MKILMVFILKAEFNWKLEISHLKHELLQNKKSIFSPWTAGNVELPPNRKKHTPQPKSRWKDFYLGKRNIKKKKSSQLYWFRNKENFHLGFFFLNQNKENNCIVSNETVWFPFIKPTPPKLIFKSDERWVAFVRRLIVLALGNMAQVGNFPTVPRGPGASPDPRGGCPWGHQAAQLAESEAREEQPAGQSREIGQAELQLP